MTSFDAWLKQVNHQFIDMDGRFPPRDPYQCWDLWAHYAVVVQGMPLAATYTNYGGSRPHSGYACNVFHNAMRVRAIADRYTVIPPGQRAKAGDVAFWEISRAYPGSHVAVVTEDRGGWLRCMSQNKGPGHDRAQMETLTKSGLLGYLRPRSNKGGAPSHETPQPKGTFMALTDKQQAELYAWAKTAASGANSLDELESAIAKRIGQSEWRDRREQRLRIIFVEEIDGKRYTVNDSPYAAAVNVSTGNILRLVDADRSGQIASLKQNYLTIDENDVADGMPLQSFMNQLKDIVQAVENREAIREGVVARTITVDGVRKALGWA